MKKKIISLLVFAVILTGCQQKNDGFSSLKKDLDFLDKSDNIMVTINVENKNEDNNFNLNFIHDKTSNNYALNGSNIKGYIEEENLYFMIEKDWYKVKLNDELKAEIQSLLPLELLDFTNIDGQSKISGFKYNEINGKTYDEAVIKVEEGKYTLAGLEETITISTNNNELSIIDQSDNEKISLIVKPTTKAIEFPTELSTAKSINMEMIFKLLLENETLPF